MATTHYGLIVPLHTFVSQKDVKDYDQNRFDLIVLNHVLENKYYALAPDRMQTLVKTLKLNQAIHSCACLAAVLRALVALEHVFYLHHVEDKKWFSSGSGKTAYLEQTPVLKGVDYEDYIREMTERSAKCTGEASPFVSKNSSVFSDLFMFRNSMLDIPMTYTDIAHEKQPLFQLGKPSSDAKHKPRNEFAFVLMDKDYSYLGHVYFWPHKKLPLTLDVIGIRTSMLNVMCETEREIGLKLFSGLLKYAHMIGKQYISVQQPLGKMPHVLKRMGFAQGGQFYYWGHVETCIDMTQWYIQKKRAQFNITLIHPWSCLSNVTFSVNAKRLQQMLNTLTTHDVEQDYLREYAAFLLETHVPQTHQEEEGNAFLEQEWKDKKTIDLLSEWYQTRRYLQRALYVADKRHSFRIAMLELMFDPKGVLERLKKNMDKRLQSEQERIGRMKSMTRETYAYGDNEEMWKDFETRRDMGEIELKWLLKERDQLSEQAKQAQLAKTFKRPVSQVIDLTRQMWW